MKHDVLQQADKYVKARQRKRRWYRVVTCLACVVVFCTTYALILPAITLEDQFACGLEEHTHTEACYTQVTAVTRTKPICTIESLNLHEHTEDCYDADGELICGYADFVVHQHVFSCYDENGNLWCPLGEIETHAHGESCFSVPETVHTHTDECCTMERVELICQLEESSDHQHTDNCYIGETVLTCELPTESADESEAAEPELICNKEEIILHEHISDCFDETGGLICGMTQVLEHVHSDACFRTVVEPVDTETLTCTLPEDENHTHTALCYGVWELTCGLEEHTHSEECRPASGLTREDQARVDEVIALIDALPTLEEVEETLTAYEEAGDMEGCEAYYAAEGQQGRYAYEMYAALTEEARAQVTNADKLWNLEWLWSAVMLIDEINSDAPTTVTAASTSDFIELNLYNYNGNINSYWEKDKKYPGFQWNGGAYLKSTYDRHTVDYIDFGNSMITDYDYAGSGNGKATTAKIVGAQGGDINALDVSTYGVTNRPIGMSIGTEVLSRTLVAGYPALKDGTSLSYLFTSGNAVTKLNTTSIDGLFQQDATTGEYYYNSRLNHAQYGNNRFTLYNQIITPNFIVYPFGNFLPFNDITDGSNATQVGKITSVGTYVQQVINDLWPDYNSNATKQQLVDMLAMYRDNLKSVSTTGGTAWTTWSAADAITDYFIGDGDNPSDDTSQITSALLNKMYNIDWDVDTNFFFGMEMKMNFMQPKGGLTGKDGQQPTVFYFTGDDDVWVYIDGVLFLDLSGIHRHVGGKIDFVNGVVEYYALDSSGTGDVSSTPYKTYTFAELLQAAGKSTDILNSSGTFKDYSFHDFNFYYMERGSGSSVCRMNFNFPLLRRNAISVAKELTVDEQDKLDLLGNPDFYFQVLKADSDGNKLTDLFINADEAYNIYDSSNTLIDTGKTDANGVFTLKAGQRAEFTDISENSGKYYVRELLDSTVFEQYGTVSVDGTSQTTNYNVTIGSDQFKGLDSTVKDMSDGSTAFHFNNQVKISMLGSLKITKKLETYPQTRTALQFQFRVTLDGVPLPAGTAYQVGLETRIVTEAGIITLGPDETAVLSNIIAGSRFTVQETAVSGAGYTVTYTGDGLKQESGENGPYVSGIIQTESAVAVTVTNSEGGTTVTIPGTKTLTNSDSGEHSFTFKLEQVIDSLGGTVVEGGISQTTSVTFPPESGENSADFLFSLNYLEKDITSLTATYYYKITEIAEDTGQVLYDPAVYIAEVTVVQENGELTATLTNLWKDGIAATSSTLSFTNTLVGDLTIGKQVKGDQNARDTEFSFTITLKQGDTPLSGSFNAVKTAENGDSVGENITVTFDASGCANIQLKHGERLKITGIPLGTDWTVTENGADSYSVSHQVNFADAESGGTGTGTITGTGATIIVTNSAIYVLPSTGGAGTDLYTVGGLLLSIGAGFLLLYKYIKRRKEDSVSS